MTEDTEGHEPLRLPETILNDLEVEQAVVKLIQHASQLRASDLFFTWSENDVAISVHHLGVLKRIAQIPHDKGRHFINAIKVAAGMHLTERFHPLDGRWVCEPESGTRSTCGSTQFQRCTARRWPFVYWIARSGCFSLRIWASIRQITPLWCAC